MRHCRMNRVSLIRACLCWADFSQSNMIEAGLRNADLSRCNMVGADFTLAKWDQTTTFPKGFDPKTSSSWMWAYRIHSEYS